ncbi:MAG: hypothetical protein M1358_21500 [Chloroflexi bacterium]|nr:hypothetical protein [Chloroflexota bacterium]
MDRLSENLEKMTYREAKRVAMTLRQKEEQKRQATQGSSPYSLSWERCSMHFIPLAPDYAEKIIETSMQLSTLLDRELVDDLEVDERENLLVHLLAIRKGIEDYISYIEESDPSLKVG